MYTHERRKHGLNIGTRILGALQARFLNDAEDDQENGNVSRDGAAGDQGREPFEMDSDDDELEAPGDMLLNPHGDLGAAEDPLESSQGEPRCPPRASQETQRDIEQSVRKELTDLLCFLEVEKAVPGTTVDRIVEALNVMATYGQQVDPCGNPLRTVLNTLDVGTAKKRQKVYQGRFGPPTGKVLWIPGIRSTKKNIYYKPMSEHLKDLLDCDEVIQTIEGRFEGEFVPWFRNHPEFVHDFQSSERYESISDDLGGEPFVGIRIYGDGFSPNSLGAHTMDNSELYGVYAQITSYPAHLCRAVKAWVTVVLADCRGVSNVSQLWAPVVSDLELLQQEGVFVPKMNRRVQVVVVSYCGDLKDQNELCAMAPPGGSRYPHATNLVSAVDRKRCSSFDDVNPLEKKRNRVDHERDIDTFQRTKCLIQSRGAKDHSVLDAIVDFVEHVGVLTPDTSHSFYLGLARADLALSLSVFLALGELSEDEIESSMTTFKTILTGDEQSNFVINMFGAVKGLRLPVKGSISQSRLLIKYSTLIFGALAEAVDEDEVLARAWNLIVLLHKFFLYVESYALSKRQLADFQDHIRRYIDLRIKVRDDFKSITKTIIHIIPKHVDMMASCEAFRATGSLVLSSTTIMESRNALHKDVLQKTKNRINCVQTLSERTEMLEKYQLESLLKDEEIIGKRFGIPKTSEHMTQRQLNEIRGICGQEYCQDLQVHGKVIRSGQIIDVYSDESCTSTKSYKVLGVDLRDREDIAFLAEDFDSEYLETFDCYGAQNFQENVTLIRVAALCNPVGYVLLPSSHAPYPFVYTRSMIVPIK